MLVGHAHEIPVLLSNYQIVQNSIRIYHFVTPAILRMADIFSISSRYGRMFSREAHIIDAIAGIYQEVLMFLQRIEALLTTRCEAQEMIFFSI